MSTQHSIPFVLFALQMSAALRCLITPRATSRHTYLHESREDKKEKTTLAIAKTEEEFDKVGR